MAHSMDDGTLTTADRFDGFTSELSKVGTSSDPHQNVDVRAGRQLSDDEIDEIYERGRFGRKIVEKPVKDALRPDIELKDDSGVLFSHEMSRRGLDVKSKIKEALYSARQTGGGALLLITDDGRDLDEPIDRQNLSRLRAIHTFDRYDLSVHEYFTDLRDKDYRKPRLYNFHPAGVGRGDDDPAKIHADRIIRFEGARVRTFRKADYGGWAQPVLEAAFECLKDLGVVSDSMGSASHQFQFGILKIARLHDLIVENDNGRDLLRERLLAMEESKSILNAVALDASENEEFEQKSTDIEQALHAYRAFQENLAYKTDMSLSVLFGQMPKGLSSSDISGRQNYFDNLEDLREDDVARAIFRIADMLSIAKNNEVLSKGAMLEFGPLDELTAPDGAEVFAQRADGHAKLVGAGVETAEDAAGRMFSDSIDSRVPENQSRRRRDAQTLTYSPP